MTKEIKNCENAEALQKIAPVASRGQCYRNGAIIYHSTYISWVEILSISLIHTQSFPIHWGVTEERDSKAAPILFSLELI
jgi:hypothetical protein